jgi:hypothetical protein
VHSRAAREALDAGIADDRVSLLPHPMLPPRSGIPRSSRTSGPPVIRVLGQYKVDRDVDMLYRLSSSFDGRADLQVHGRGWPDIPGWSVHCAFVTEEEMEELISSSDVVLVPYKRFFQSGIAIRCLENRTPFVGPAGSSLDELYGGASSMLAREPGEWVAAIRYAIDQGREETTRAGWSWRSRCEKAWSRWPNR